MGLMMMREDDDQHDKNQDEDKQLMVLAGAPSCVLQWKFFFCFYH